jgi:hypothetical protein
VVDAYERDERRKRTLSPPGPAGGNRLSPWRMRARGNRR